MKYYKLISAEGYDWIWSNEIELRRYSMDFEGKPMSDKWTKLSLDYVDKGKKDFDICVATSPLYIFSKNAVKFLNNTLVKYGELLPVSSPNENFIAYHCTNIIEKAFDIEKSKIKWLDKNKGWISNIEQYSLNKDEIKNDLIFRIPSKYSYKTFFSEDFKSLVESKNLKAFRFEEICIK